MFESHLTTFCLANDFLFAGLTAYNIQLKVFLKGVPIITIIIMITAFLLRPLQEGHGCITSTLINTVIERLTQN